jgi:cytochrome c-type protein NapB
MKADYSDSHISMMETVMKRIVITACAALLVAPLVASAGVKGLRSNDLAAGADESQRVKVVEEKGGFARTYDKQPPLIPHTIDKDEINLKVNTCLSQCHEEGKKKAPKPLESHYTNREGQKSDKVVAGRYNCTQCHATMTDAKPLVDNVFEGHITKK